MCPDHSQVFSDSVFTIENTLRIAVPHEWRICKDVVLHQGKSKLGRIIPPEIAEQIITGGRLFYSEFVLMRKECRYNSAQLLQIQTAISQVFYYKDLFYQYGRN